MLPPADVDLPLDWSELPPKEGMQCGTPERIRKLFRLQRSVPGYRSLIQSNVTIFGTIDGELESKLVKQFSPRMIESYDVLCTMLAATLVLQQITIMVVTMPTAPSRTSSKAPRHL